MRSPALEVNVRLVNQVKRACEAQNTGRTRAPYLNLTSNSSSSSFNQHLDLTPPP